MVKRGEMYGKCGQNPAHFLIVTALFRWGELNEEPVTL
jgi:hypothetical protein